ncbi:MAG TPA: PilN domain-containing protein [Anaerolineales bacterium]
MIRINLLGAQKPRKGKRQALPSAGLSGVGPEIVVAALVVLLLTAALNGLWYWQMKRQSAKLDAQIRQADVDYQRLALVKQIFEEREKEKNIYQKRVDVIDTLRKQQSGPVTLLTTLGDTVNHTDGVWMGSMTDDGANINLKGTALSINAVANLIHNLDKTGYFKTVEIKESFQDDAVKDVQVFQFTLQCQKAAASPAAAAKPAGKV